MSSSIKISAEKIQNEIAVSILMAASDNLPQYRKDFWRDKGLSIIRFLHDCSAISLDQYTELYSSLIEAAKEPTKNKELEQDYEARF